MIGFDSSLFILTFLIQAIGSHANYNLTVLAPLLHNQTLVSSSQIFELGFFTPNGSENQYVGIWYKNMTPSKIVWVANREKPLRSTDLSAIFKISSDGNLKLVDGQMNTVWSTNASIQPNYTVATLSDDGNFVLTDQSCNKLWSSFNNLTDTLLPIAKMGLNLKTGETKLLSSWRSDNDPSAGNFALELTSETPPQPFIRNGSTPYWRGGPWDKAKFIGIPVMPETYLSWFHVEEDAHRGTKYYYIDSYNNSFFWYTFISPGGSVKIMYWNYEAKSWLTFWEAPANRCEVYGTCGPFGICNPMHSPICRCVKGFKPKFIDEWSSENWTAGCIRETELNCPNSTSRSVSTSEKPDIFVQLSQVKLPDSQKYLKDIRNSQGCQSWCLDNCSCLGYSYVSNIGCMVWSEVLIDIMEFSSTGEDLFFRLAHTGVPAQTKLIISLSSVFGIIVTRAAIYGVCRLRDNCTGDCKETPALLNSVDRIERLAELQQETHEKSSSTKMMHQN